VIDELDSEARDAARWYWETLSGQAADQRQSDDSTRGRRAEVLGGKQMDGFASLVEDILVEAGVPRDAVKHDYHATLPGFFRHEKEWDTAVVHDDELLAVVEYKSQASSFGNNLNNRAEEVIGSFTDLIEAYEDGVFAPSPQPWIGYMMLMADNDESRNVPRVREVNFEVDDEYRDATYVDRMELLSAHGATASRQPGSIHPHRRGTRPRGRVLGAERRTSLSTIRPFAGLARAGARRQPARHRCPSGRRRVALPTLKYERELSQGNE
jgi:hypothetical protein